MKNLSWEILFHAKCQGIKIVLAIGYFIMFYNCAILQIWSRNSIWSSNNFKCQSCKNNEFILRGCFIGISETCLVSGKELDLKQKLDSLDSRGSNTCSVTGVKRKVLFKLLLRIGNSVIKLGNNFLVKLKPHHQSLCAIPSIRFRFSQIYTTN